MVSGNNNNHYWQVFLAVKSQYFRISDQELWIVRSLPPPVARPTTSRARRAIRGPACSHQSGWVIGVVVSEIGPGAKVGQARRRGQCRWRYRRRDRSRGGPGSDKDSTTNTSRFVAGAPGRRRRRASAWGGPPVLRHDARSVARPSKRHGTGPLSRLAPFPSWWLGPA